MSAFASIPEILEDVRAGRMTILVDDESRENEGDIILAAEKATPEAVNFMRLHTGGVICLAMANDRADRLGLPPMVALNTSSRGTAFTVSIDARHGIATGISAADRTTTILAAANDQCKPEDLVRPGHIFPLRAKDGGVLVRAGHTEGSVDLCRLAGLRPVAVISEVMNEDGTMARVPDILAFGERHGIKVSTIAALIEHRRRGERIVEKIDAVKLPTRFGDFRLHLYRSLVDEYLHIALCAGDVGEGRVLEEPVLVRVHSECLTGDVFHSMRCECGEQLEAAIERISADGRGVLLYIRQEGRGIGLVDKIKSYALQERGLDTVEANVKLGLPADLREYGTGAQILFDLGVRKMRLLTNNPKKVHSIGGYGLEIVEQLPIEIPPSEHNRDYLRAKRDKMGHVFRKINDLIEGT